MLLSSAPELLPPIRAKGVKTPDERLAQCRANIARGLPPLEHFDAHQRRIDICGYAPSIAQTWGEATGDVLTISGAHGLMLEHGVAPKYHLEVDPRDDKTAYISPPCLTTTYLFASQCHPSMFDAVRGYKSRIWHAFNTPEESELLLAELPEETSLMVGGSTAGLFAMVVAYFLGYRDIHVHGMDSSNASPTQRHAGPHYGKPQEPLLIRVGEGGPEYWTSRQMASQAREFFNVCERMPDAQITVHGTGLLQSMIPIEHKQRPMPWLRRYE